ncbi:outer membrane protein Iml2/Tetratricopeptide repeat protein 39 [Pisolithus sp. B1]|nr:outer membrane protein Iml2/Tetratricopeptide repeat protein 39 [Pisolithus sp. B1]
MASAQDTEEMFRLASQAFDLLLDNEPEAAADIFSAEGQENSPFHLLGLGVCALLKAVLEMEPQFMKDAVRCFTLAKQAARKHVKLAKPSTSSHRFQPGLEWEVICTDAMVFLGICHALSKSYKGYLQCLSVSDTRLFKTTYPKGLDAYATPSQLTPATSRKPSEGNLHYAETTPAIPVRTSRFFPQWTGLRALTTFTPVSDNITNPANGPVEELILSGAALGYGLVNLILSLLPAKIRKVVGFLGYNHDRQSALKALEVSAARTGVHAVTAGMVLTAYYGVLLLTSGYQADRKHIIDQYRGIVWRTSQHYPKGSLWRLNKARIQRMTGDPEGAIVTLQEGLQDGQPKPFPQADVMLVFEMAWTLLQCRRYEESAQVFMEVTKMNSWNYATCYFLAAGCYVSIRQSDKAQRLLDELLEIMDKRGSRDVAMEVFIKKKLAFYQRKHTRRGGNSGRFVESMKISPAEGEVDTSSWNTHAHADKETALAHIEELTVLTPPVDIQTDYMSSSSSTYPPGGLPDLDTPDELAVRSLILGVLHRTLGDYAGARKLLHDALKHRRNADLNSWIGGVTHFELAVLDMKEGEWRSAAVSKGGPAEGDTVLVVWKCAIKNAKDALAQARALCTRETDLSSRLDGRIVMLWEEIDVKMRELRISNL